MYQLFVAVLFSPGELSGNLSDIFFFLIPTLFHISWPLFCSIHSPNTFSSQGFCSCYFFFLLLAIPCLLGSWLSVVSFQCGHWPLEYKYGPSWNQRPRRGFSGYPVIFLSHLGDKNNEEDIFAQDSKSASHTWKKLRTRPDTEGNMKKHGKEKILCLVREAKLTLVYFTCITNWGEGNIAISIEKS